MAFRRRGRFRRIRRMFRRVRGRFRGRGRRTSRRSLLAKIGGISL